MTTERVTTFEEFTDQARAVFHRRYREPQELPERLLIQRYRDISESFQLLLEAYDGLVRLEHESG